MSQRSDTFMDTCVKTIVFYVFSLCYDLHFPLKAWTISVQKCWPITLLLSNILLFLIIIFALRFIYQKTLSPLVYAVTHTPPKISEINVF